MLAKNKIFISFNESAVTKVSDQNTSGDCVRPWLPLGRNLGRKHWYFMENICHVSIDNQDQLNKQSTSL